MDPLYLDIITKYYYPYLHIYILNYFTQFLQEKKKKKKKK